MIKNFFSAEKCLDSLLLNILGMQAFRYIFTKLIFWVIYNFKNLDKNNYDRLKTLFNEGYSIKKNFLKDQSFNELKSEFFQAINEHGIIEKQTADENQDGTEYTTLYIDEKMKNKYPKIYEFKNNLFIKNYFSTCEQKKNYHLYCRLEMIKVLDENINDPNKDYHYDTFHNTFKCWLFINNVENNDGPFRYLPASNKFSFKRLFFEWKNSILYSLKKNINPSFRTNNKLKETLDKDSMSMSVGENTLVMANTHGLHRRGDAKVGGKRCAIQFWTRENPYKIFFN